MRRKPPFSGTEACGTDVAMSLPHERRHRTGGSDMKALGILVPGLLAGAIGACSTLDDGEEDRVGEAVDEQVAPPVPPAPPALTFSARYDSKLFINGVPNCGSLPVGLLQPWKNAAFLAFCKATAFNFNENPLSGALANPLDARIHGSAEAEWRCRVGNPAPIGPASAVALGTFGGPEPGGLMGVANQIGVRDQLLANGSYGFVFSGRPDPRAELIPQAIQPRLRSDIWNHLTASVTCGVDGRGLPKATVNYGFTATLFPSHRVWRITPKMAPRNTEALLFNVVQGALSNLWSLPAIPAP
jgi:hypothetical protein